jgi:hypothetical protein
MKSLNSVTVLNDQAIRTGLLSKLSNAAIAPKAIIEELRVHNGNAIADVVAIHKEAHCYEIKGENDSIRRIEAQGRYYDLVFGKVTLVTTKNHLQSGLEIIPSHWGVILATAIDGRVMLVHKRRATTNPIFDKRLALLTLWRSELTFVANGLTDANIAKMNRHNLTILISECFGKTKLRHMIGDRLVERSARLGHT